MSISRAKGLMLFGERFDVFRENSTGHVNRVVQNAEIVNVERVRCEN